MAAAKSSIIRVKGSTIVTPKGQALFVSCPAASSYDADKQEASILLSAEDATALQATLQDFVDSAEVKATKIKDTGFVASLFKEDTDQEGNLTGLQRVKAKTAMQYPAKLYEADGTVFTPPAGFQIQNRSDIRMSVKPEVMQTSMFTGIVLRLQAIKIIDVPSFDDGMASFEDEGSFSMHDTNVAPTGDDDGMGKDEWA